MIAPRAPKEDSQQRLKITTPSAQPVIWVVINRKKDKQCAYAAFLAKWHPHLVLLRVLNVPFITSLTCLEARLASCAKKVGILMKKD